VRLLSVSSFNGKPQASLFVCDYAYGSPLNKKAQCGLNQHPWLSPFGSKKMTPPGDSLLLLDSFKMRPNQSRLKSPEP